MNKLYVSCMISDELLLTGERTSSSHIDGKCDGKSRVIMTAYCTVLL